VSKFRVTMDSFKVARNANTDNMGKLFPAFAGQVVTLFVFDPAQTARCLPPTLLTLRSGSSIRSGQDRVTRPRGRLAPRLCGSGSSLKQPTVPRSNWLLPKISHWRPRSFWLLPKIAHWAISKRSAPIRSVLLPGRYA